jgi:hypothetical protein
MQWTDPGDETVVEGLIPDEADVDTAILRQRNNNAPGIDGIPVELPKANEAIKEIHKLTAKIWRTEQIPHDWKHTASYAQSTRTKETNYHVTIIEGYHFYAQVIKYSQQCSKTSWKYTQNR